MIQAGFTNEQTGALSDVLSKLLTRDEFQEFRHGEFQEFRHETSERFTKIEARLDGMDTRLDGVDTRLNNLETRFGRMEDHLSDLKNEMHKMSSRIFMAMMSVSVVAITAMLPATLYVITRFPP